MAKRKKKASVADAEKAVEASVAETVAVLEAPAEDTLVEVIGPGGRHFVKSSRLPELKRKGFLTVEEYKYGSNIRS